MGAMKDMLEEAAAAVEGDRNDQYGGPQANFKRIAAMWGAYLGVPIEPHDVGAMLAIVKVSRIRETPQKKDSWVDLAGYAACGWDCAREPDDWSIDEVKPDSYFDRPVDFDVSPLKGTGSAP